MTANQDIKQGARKTWAEGDYRAVAQFLPPASAHLVKAAGVRSGDSVLDVACGTGVTAITAARAGATVTGVDLTPDLLAVAEDEAALAQVKGITWREEDAEALSCADASFDVVLSSFGHMFAPDPEATTRELIRVTKPGGRIAFVTWPPESAVGQMIKAVGAVLPPPPGASPPIQWGVPEIVRERLGSAVTDLHFERGSVAWPMLSSGHLWDLFRTSYGPFVVALGKLSSDPAKQQAFARNIQAIFDRYFQDNEVTFEYLLTRATKV